METEAELRAMLKRARSELSRIEDKRALAENVKLIGKCFKYRNSYSCPEKASDYWWLYCFVIGANENGLRLFEFQTDNRGRIEIRPEGLAFSADIMRHGYIPITKAEYRKAWERTVRKIKAMNTTDADTR